jgi:serine/threonine protein kinase
MPHLFFAAGEDDEAARPTPSAHLLGAGQNMWGKTWNKVGGWLKKEDDENDENEPPAGTEAHDILDEKEEEQVTSSARPQRPVVPCLQRPTTFNRQNSEQRERLCPYEPDPEERRALSADRRTSTTYLRKPLPPPAPLPRSPSPTTHTPDGADSGRAPAEEPNHQSSSAEARQDGQEEHGDAELEPVPFMSHHDMMRDQEHLSEALDDLQIQAELEAKWILNLSMHFRDNSDREKFFITYAEAPNKWRRVTISCDYRNVPADSLEADLKSLHYQRDKSARIYESIRDSLPSIQFYPAVTNLKLQTDDGRLHVHVTEDVNEKIPYPSVSLLRHLNCTRFKESTIEFDSHLSGFVYKIRSGGRVYIKKEIPGPEAVDEFLYEVNALSSLCGTSNVVQFEGIVVDDDEKLIKGLLIGYCEQGALVDVIYDYKHSEWLPWTRRERWAKEIVKGLSEIHEAGFVQGDFTLSNIVIDGDDTARIIDINRRGCPVGWEPPELSKLIQSGQRISIFIGVKSDLFQLGMVLWALAEQQDEPERQEGPLRLGNSTEVPDYYREVVESCLNPNPKFRLSAKDLFAKFPALENNPPQERDSRSCLSPHRSEKEYIDPATAVGLEDIDQLKTITRHGRESQFSTSEVTFADCTTSSEYLFVSSGSEVVGHRGRSPVLGSDRAQRRSAVSIDLEESEAAMGHREPDMTEIDDDPNIVEPTTKCSQKVDEVPLEPATNAMEHSFVSSTTATPVKDVDQLDQTEPKSSDPTPTLRQDSNDTVVPMESEVVAQSLLPVDVPLQEPPRIRAFGPPIHQDSGFHEISSLESQLPNLPSFPTFEFEKFTGDGEAYRIPSHRTSTMELPISNVPILEDPFIDNRSLTAEPKDILDAHSTPIADTTTHSQHAMVEST